MNKISHLVCLIIILSLTSCNETVSPELQEGSGSGSGSGEAPSFTSSYEFKVVDKSPSSLNYKLHKSGNGNYNTDCSIKSDTAFSSAAFKGSADPFEGNTAFDITCFFEAEELALYYNGFSFEFQATKNTCDYVGYSPYGFYDRMPGNSSATYYEFRCSSDIDNTELRSAITSGDPDVVENLIDNTETTVSCDSILVDDDLIARDTRKPLVIENYDDLCKYNYSDGVKCDEGEITIFKKTIGEDEDNFTITTSKVTHKCGGSHLNCISGPIKDMTSSLSRMTLITAPGETSEVQQKYTYKKLIPDGEENTKDYYSTLKYANYRRNLASTDIDFINSAKVSLKGTYHDATYPGKWADQKEFNPIVAELFAANLKADGETALIDLTPGAANELTTAFQKALRDGSKNQIYSIPLAADPFVGLTSANRVNPFYTFYCFDNALDVKARIRMVVRDWDRAFAQNATLELLSDLSATTSALQDNNNDEVDDDIGSHLSYNDLLDWDDLIPMRRSDGAFDKNTTVWFPWTTSGNPADDESTDEGIWFENDLFPIEEWEGELEN